MKNALIIALTVLKLVVEGVPSVSAETRWEHWLQSHTSASVQAGKSSQPSHQPANQPSDQAQSKLLLIRDVKVETAPQSERDRLIQERFLIKLIPAQNQ